MSSNVFVDGASVMQLKEQFISFDTETQALMRDVDAHLNEQMHRIEEHKEDIKRLLIQFETELQKAQTEYDAVLAKRPSGAGKTDEEYKKAEERWQRCVENEKRKVEKAQEKVEKWRLRLNSAERIIRECTGQINNLNNSETQLQKLPVSFCVSKLGDIFDKYNAIKKNNSFK